MKKHVMALLLAAVVTSTAIGLSACGEKGNDINGNGITANTDPAMIVSERVADQAAWKAAFDYSEITNFSFKRSSIIDGTFYSIENEIWNVSVDRMYGSLGYVNRKTDDKGEFIIENGEYVYEEKEPERQYEYKQNEKCYLLKNVYDKDYWVREEISDYENDYGKHVFSKAEYIVNGYADFTYDEDKNAYVGNVHYVGPATENVRIYKCTVKIVGGKVVYWEEQYNETHNDVIFTFSRTAMIFDVGKTTVRLPSNIVDREQQTQE